MNSQMKKARNTNSGPSKAFPIKRDDVKSRRTFRQLGRPAPPLKSLDVEVAIFEVLITDPSREFYYTMGRTLSALRWMGAERVAKAAKIAGKTRIETLELLMNTVALGANPPFYFTPACAAWVIGSDTAGAQS